MSKSFLLTIRETARECTDIDLQGALRAAADNLDEALSALWTHATEGNMQLVNGRWAYAHRLMERVESTAPAGNGAGLVQGAELQRMAA
jgi:3-hydroxy-3-methylglutaryl CoA synthase